MHRGTIVALHPTLVYSSTHVQVAGLGATLLVWTMVLAHQAGMSGRIGGELFGALLALLTLTDPILCGWSFRV